MILQALFPDDYGQARDRFRQLAVLHGFDLESHAMPDDSELAMDIASLGDDGAGPLLILSGGLHGVEGFFGSTVQQACFSELAKNWSGRVLMIHAMNPFGFQHLRRVNEQNIDLNRNFVLDGNAYAGSDRAYATLDHLINPRSRAMSKLFYLRAAAALFRYGDRYIKQSLVGGQYGFPEGLYFGGTEPTWTHQVVSQNIDRWVGDAETIIHLDFHTGLGRYGKYIVMMEPGAEPSTYDFAQREFAGHNVRLPHGTEKAYQARGNIGSWLNQRLDGRRYLYFCAEFGTYAPVRMLAAMCEENLAFHCDGLGSSKHQNAAQQLRKMFVPESPRWRRRVLEASLKLVLHGANLRAV